MTTLLVPRRGAAALVPLLVTLSVMVIPASPALANVPETADRGGIAIAAADPSQAGPQLVKNAGFESSRSWEPDGQGFSRGTAPVRTGKYAIRCENRDPEKGSGAGQTVILRQRSPVPILVEAWSSCEGVSGSADADYSLYLDLTFSDGTSQWGQVSSFQTGTHDWERREVSVFPSKPIRSVRVSLLLRHHTGTAWFDDVTLRQLSPRDGVGFFDGVAVSTRRAETEAAHPSTLIIGDTQFKLRLSAVNGRPIEILSGRHAFKLSRRSMAGGILVRDAGSGSSFYGLSTPPAIPGRSGSGVEPEAAQSEQFSALGLKVSVSYRSRPGAIEITGAVADTTGRDRAVTIYYALPIAPHNLRWWDTLRQSRRVRDRGIYANMVHVGVGNTGEMSRYPLSCLQTTRLALTLAAPMDLPRITRLCYDSASGQYYAAMDFGLSPETPPGTFRFILYASDSETGMRGALARYYELFPASFVRRARREGIWMPFTKISTVKSPDDFGFAFKEGDNEVAWDDAHDMATFRYTEPMSWWMTMPAGADRSYDGIVRYLYAYASGNKGGNVSQAYARSVLLSGDYGPDGRYAATPVDAPWAHGALFINNCNPRIPDRVGYLNRAHVAWSDEIARSLYDDHSRGILDGEYLDSLEGWADTKNFRRDHFGHEAEPLTFDTETKQVCILQGVSTFEFTKQMAADVHARGKLMFANSTPWRFYWYAPLLDVMGTETNWLDAGQYHPEPDEMMLYRRLVSGVKPYLLLMNTDYDQFDHHMVELYLQRSLFYGIYPSMFSHNAADNPYWENSRWYDRDRDLFRKYIPIIRDLGRLGWHPVTGAISSDAGVWVERFGGNADGAAFTVLNSGDTPKTIRISFSDAHALPDRYLDRISGRTLAVGNSSGGGFVQLTLGRQGCAALFPKEGSFGNRRVTE